MIKGSIHQEDIKIVNVYTSNIDTPKYIKQLTELKQEKDSNNSRRLQYSTLNNRLIIQIVNQQIFGMNNTIDKWTTQISNYRIHILFKLHGTFSRTDHNVRP